MKIVGYVVYDFEKLLELYYFECCVFCDEDVLIEIFYCGVCYLDLYIVENDWGWI